jgi:hypothetical protein
LAIAKALQITQEKITSGSITRVVVYPDSQAVLITIKDFRFGNRFHGGPMIRNIITAQRKFQGKWPPKLEAFDVALSRRFPRRQVSRPGQGTALR